VHESIALDPESNLRLRFNALIESGDVSLDRLLGTLRSALLEASAPDMRRLRLFLRHVLYLMSSGEELFVECLLRRHGGVRPMLIVRRVAREHDEGVMKTTLKLASWPMASVAPSLATGAFAAHAGQFEAIVHRGPVVVASPVPGAAMSGASTVLKPDEVDAFYANRRAIQVVLDDTQGDAVSRRSQEAAARQDAEHVVAACREAFAYDPDDAGVIRGGRAVPGGDRSTHPCIGATLHVLPRLVRPTGGVSVLRGLAASMGDVAAAGFDALLLGVVDPQSLDLFLSEEDDGVLRPYENNHGYWSSGRCGIDPVLGEVEDYRALVCAASESGLTFIQDSVFGTLGYLPQIARLASVGSGCTPSTLYLGDRSASLSEQALFLRKLKSGEDVPPLRDQCLHAYVSVAVQTHMSQYFDLPRPNLHSADVMERVLQRVRWQISAAGVHAFRIDMAKHIGVAPLREIIAALHQATRTRSTSRPLVIMEYLSTDYRDLRFALSCAGEQAEGVYVYDFPLAHALQQAMLAGGDWSVLLRAIADQRGLWGVPPCCLVPIFIDHDSSYRPIYNGSARTRDVVVVGMAAALAMSANGPSVYSAYDDRHAAPANPDDYGASTEQVARTALPLPLVADPDGPGIPLSRLLAVVNRFRLLPDWDGQALAFEGNADRLRISRTLHGGGSTRTVTMCLSRSDDASAMGREGEQLEYVFGDGPSVAMFVVGVA
jgi:hypothetical protein